MMSLLKQQYKVTLIGLFIIFMSLWQLTTNPPVWYDEGIYHQIVRNLAVHHVYGLYLGNGAFSDMSFISVGYPVFFPAALVMSVFHDSDLVLRAVAVVFLLLFAATFFWVARTLYGQRLATWSLALLALFSPLYGNGKTFLGEVPGLMYLMIGCLFLLANQARRPYCQAFLAGLFLGFAASAKPLYLLLLPAAAIGVACEYRMWLLTRPGRIRLVLVGLGGVVALSLWLLTQFGLTSDQAALFEHYRNPNMVTESANTVMQNAKRFVSEATPAHYGGLLFIALIFLVIRYKKKDRISAVEIMLLSFALFTVVFYVRTVGWYRYLFPAHALLFLFFPVAVEHIIKLYKHAQLKAGVGTAVICSLLLFFQAYPFYQERLKNQTDEVVFFDSIFKKIDARSAVLFYNTPTLVARFNRQNYSQEIALSPTIVYGQKNLAGLERGEYGYVFALINDLPKILIPDCYVSEVDHAGVRVFHLDPDKLCN